MQTPFTLVFALDKKLVSVQDHFETIFNIGSGFDEIFSVTDNDFLAIHDNLKTKPKMLKLNLNQYIYTYLSHVMKNQAGHKLAVIITLLENKQSYNKIDKAMVRMDRLAQVGQLAASIAHEIKNPLAGINANVQVLSEMLKNDKSFSPFFPIIIEEVNRVDKIITNLLDYSKLQKPCLQPIDITNVIDHVKNLVSAQLHKKNIKLITPLKNNFPQIQADYNQLTQVFLNCILNSSQAMPDGGDIIINAHITLNQKQLEITIKDNGLGISRDVMNKIFEPFFTTRTKGLGLGLSVTQKIMDDHNGLISIKSKKNNGTTISLFFFFFPDQEVSERKL